MIAYAYIDGLNLYYGIRRWPAYKWLNLEALVDRLFPKDDVRAIRYFTTRVKGKLDPGSPRRQQAYLRALTTLSRVQIHYGTFIVKRRWMPLDHKSNCRVPVIRTEEKGSDVNLATYLLWDAIEARGEMAVVVSNDSDLLEPIQIVQRKPFNLPVWVVNPLQPYKTKMGATHHIDLNVADVRDSQLPDVVGLPKGKSVKRPDAWR